MIRQFLAFIFLIGLNSLILCGALSTPQSIVDVISDYTQNSIVGTRGNAAYIALVKKRKGSGNKRRSTRSWLDRQFRPVFWLFCTFHLLCPVFGHGQDAKEHADTIINGMVVSMDGQRHIYEDGAVVVAGDTIVAVGPRTELETKYDARQKIDATNKLILPGFINGHTHVPMTLFRGLHDDVTLNDWLYKYIFPAEAKNVTESFVRWGTRLAAAEQIRSGVTTFADMYYFEDAVAEETKTAGMRGILGETFIDFPAPDNKTNAAMLAYTEKFLQSGRAIR